MGMFWMLLWACGEKEKEAPSLPSSEPESTVGPCDQDVDADCDGVVDEEDCDPNDGLVYPGAIEIPYDGKDNDCAGDGDLNDVDGDGYVGQSAGGDDCNDNNATVHPGAVEICYDGLDQDCMGDLEAENNNDCDGDGHIGRGTESTDCNDEDPNINPDMEEIWYDGVDQDCDSRDDFDADFDGDPAAAYGGGDCDDNDPLSSSLNLEVWDGYDRDCDGTVDNLGSFDVYSSYYATALSDDQRLGAAAAIMGDYTGDGLQEIAVASPFGLYDQETQASGGKVYIFTLTASNGIPTDIAHTVINGAPSAYLGYDMAQVGDIDGDGIIDLAVGSPSYGEVYIFAGSTLAAGGVLSMSEHLTSLSDGTFHGIDVHNIGDLDGDGYAELATGTGGYFDATASISIWSGSDLGSGEALGAPDTFVKLTGPGVGGETAGGVDFTGDGIFDIAAAYQTDSNPKVSIISGASLLEGGILDMSDFPLITGSALDTDGDPTSFASDLGVAEDIDQDGYAELLIAASRRDTAFSGAGQVYMIDGDVANSGGAALNIADIIFEGAEDCAELSTNDHSGDYDGDGVPDVIVSQLNTDAFNCQSSLYPTTHVFFGTDLSSGTYLSTDSSAYFVSRDYSDGLGMEGIPFDMEGDGDDDILLGAPRKGGNLGYVFVFESQMGGE